MSLFPLGLISQGGGAGGGANALTLISTQLVASATTSITFSSIPSTPYKHLQLRITHKQNSGASLNFLNLRFNSDTTANQASHWVRGNSASVVSSNQLSSNYLAIDRSPYSTNMYGATIVDILDYANTSKNKTVRSLGGFVDSSQYEVGLYSALWPSTAAIDTILVYLANSFSVGSRISLYGVS